MELCRLLRLAAAEGESRGIIHTHGTRKNARASERGVANTSATMPSLIIARVYRGWVVCSGIPWSWGEKNSHFISFIFKLKASNDWNSS
jgi:hypothetical protein